MNAKELTELVEKQALMIEQLAARIDGLEASRERMLVWAEKVQAHNAYLEGKAKPAPKRETEWKSGPRPSHPVRRPAAPAAAAAELPPEPEEFPPCAGSEVPEDCPF